MADVVCASVAEVHWGSGQGLVAVRPGISWDGIGLGNVLRGQYLGRGTVLLARGSFTHSVLCGLVLLGRNLLGFWGGPSSGTMD